MSSGTAVVGENGSSSPAGSLVDLMAKHVRAILGQHFWAATGEEDATKHRHLTLLELLITVMRFFGLRKDVSHLLLNHQISLHFLRSFFLNSPICPVTETDLVMAWKCKVIQI